jgi:predicted MFS family arabinose efflux permease
MLVSSWLWHLTRWAGLFLCTYLVTHLGGHPIDNQFVGVSMFAPMLLGAYLSKLTKTRLDPQTLVVATELALLPASAAMAGLVAGGAVQIWMAYLLMLAYGFGGVVNMTAQREVLFGLAGPVRADRTLNMEMTGVASAMMIGPLLGGLSIGVIGLGGAFAVLAVLLVGSSAILLRQSAGLPKRLPMSSTHPELEMPSNVSTISAASRNGLVLLREAPNLAAILAVTVIVNLCYFAFIPLVPVIAKHFHGGPTLAGVIGSAAGTAQFVAATGLVARPAQRGGRSYVGGAAICLCCLALLPLAPTVAFALLALGIAGVGQAFFGALQATLPVAAVPAHERSAALGLLSTTIGVALPCGMLILGVTSSLLGARSAMFVSAVVGFGALSTLVMRNPGLVRREHSGRAIRAGRESDAIAAQPELG